MSEISKAVSPQKSLSQNIAHHLAGLDGLRAVAALGIIVTHVSFQVGTGWHFADRFDYFVAVFFALSAFLLWRRRDAHPPRVYYRNRFFRIAPAYLVCVVAVLLLFPGARSLAPSTVIANLTSTQVFWEDGLAPGLTHLWSLCIEISFYVVLPLCAGVLRGRARRTRVLVIAAAAVVSLGWAWLPFVQSLEVNAQIWPPAYGLWFAVGMLAAEYEEPVRAGRAPAWVTRACAVRWPWWIAAAACMWLASREFFGPAGLEHPSPSEFARRILVGGVFAFCVVVPYALCPRSRFLESVPMQALGRWSYSIFLWHMAVLGVAFPLTGVPLFGGGWVNFMVILVVTVALTIPVAAASYVLVEEPARRLGRVLWRRHPSAAAARTMSSSESPA